MPATASPMTPYAAARSNPRESKSPPSNGMTTMISSGKRPLRNAAAE